jgi:hypothetical protein
MRRMLLVVVVAVLAAGLGWAASKIGVMPRGCPPGITWNPPEEC